MIKVGKRLLLSRLRTCWCSRPQRGGAIQRLLVAGVLVLAAAPPLAPQVTATADAEARARAEASTVFRVATERLAELGRREGLESRTEMLARNLSRYFVVYLVPEEVEELQRVLGTVQRMTQQAARVVLRMAREQATARGSTQIDAEDVDTAAERLLPRRRGRIDDWEYFPVATVVSLEDWDLEALLSTGLAWEVVGFLADAEIGPDPTWPPITEAAAVRLGEVANAYGMLVFRLGGEHARAELAPYMKTPHLRLAGKTIAERASGQKNVVLQQSEPAASGSLFTDVTATAGITFLHNSSAWIARQRRFGHIAPSFSGGGVAAGDVDGDSWDDLVFCGGHGCALYVNRGDGTFEDRTARSGIGFDGEARMPLLADFDNDGDRDLFITYARDTNRLFENRGDGTFVDVTAASGLERAGDLSGPAVAVDVDGDAFLDIYVGNFGDYLEGASAWIAIDAKNGQPNRLYKNRGAAAGGLRFEDTTERAGVGDLGWAQALSHLDYDRDGDQDLYVANDFGRNQLYSNRGDGTFDAVGEGASADDPHHGMNVAFADLNRDRLADILITNIWFWAAAKREVTETNTLLLSLRQPNGSVSYQRSDAAALRDHDSGWAWAALFLDVENDADDDLFIANGFTDYMTFVQYREHPTIPGQLYPIHNDRDPNMLFLNDGGAGTLPSLPSRLLEDSGAEVAGRNSRSAALLDFDHDGDLDLAITTFHSDARLLRNDAGDRARDTAGRWLTLELVGDPARGSNRDAIGAVVIATSPADPDLYVWRMVNGGEGYLGQNTTAVELGVGVAKEVDLEITWPSGNVERIEHVPTNRALRRVEGRGSFDELWPPVAASPPAHQSPGARRQ